MEGKEMIRGMLEEEDVVVLIGLVIIFKEQITKLLENIFKEVNSQSKEVY